jgi:hypothetical protein
MPHANGTAARHDLQLPVLDWMPVAASAAALRALVEMLQEENRMSGLL